MSSSFTTSICQIAPLSCTHRVKIIGQSLTAGMDSDETIQCSTFSLGGYQWAIIFCPNYRQTPGYTVYKVTTYEMTSYVSFLLKLLSEAKHVVVFLSFSVVKETDAALVTNTRSKASVIQTKGGAFTYTKKGEQKGFSEFLARNYLDFKDDNFTIQCDLHIINPSIEYIMPVPPSDLQQHFGSLLQRKDGADLSFKVKGEIFPAHRCILAARSSVFQAELSGSSSEISKDGCIEIEDMEPEVFKALLHFIYTDTLCSNDGNDQAINEDTMAKHLIVASDRYDLHRLKLISEDKLARGICLDNVVSILMIAAQHNCQNLEKICLDFMCSAEHFYSLIETDAFERLTASRPSIYKELLKKVAAKMNMTELNIS
jgi:speckle-type POZ protein